MRTSSSAARRQRYLSHANWIACWFKCGENLPTFGHERLISKKKKKKFHYHSADILGQVSSDFDIYLFQLLFSRVIPLL